MKYAVLDATDHYYIIQWRGALQEWHIMIEAGPIATATMAQRIAKALEARSDE